MAQVIDLAARRKRASSPQRRLAARELLADWAFVGRRAGLPALIASPAPLLLHWLLASLVDTWSALQPLLMAASEPTTALAYVLCAAGSALWAGVVLEACLPLGATGSLERFLARRGILAAAHGNRA